MPDRTSIATDASGRRVMAKVAGNAEEAGRLQHEASQLEAARHPGVVDLVGVEGHGVGAILLTAHVEGPSLAQVGRLPLEESAGLLAELAATLADLHDLGLIHGSVSPEHVIVGPNGRPVLCGFAYGGQVGDPLGPAGTVAKGFADPARDDADTYSPTFDVFGLGALAHFLAPHPPAGHVLATAAAQAVSEDPSSRPSAGALAETLRHAVPESRLPRGLDARPAPRPVLAPGDPLAALRGPLGQSGRRRSRRPPGTILVGTAVAIAVVVGAVVLLGPTRQPSPALETELGAPVPTAPEPDAAGEPEPGPTTTRARLTATTALPMPTLPPTTVGGRRDCPAAVALLQADIDGDGCPDALRYADGVLDAGGVRWTLGQPGDQVATGDWACQGSRTLALFRPSTGEVFRFDGWAAPGRDLTASVVARVPGGLALRAADVDRDGCHEVVVERVSGPAEVVRLPRAQP